MVIWSVVLSIQEHPQEQLRHALLGSPHRGLSLPDDVQPWTLDTPKEFGTFVLCKFLIDKANYQGNIYSLLNDKSKKIATPISVMQ